MVPPYNNNSPYGNHYDPVGSQYNNQHQRGYTYPSQRSEQTAQSTANYQSSYSNTYSAGPSYYSWSQATAQPPNNNEDRAAEALSHLSAHDQGTATAAANTSSSSTTTSVPRAATGQYTAYESTYSYPSYSNAPQNYSASASQNAPRPSQSPANTYQYPAPVSKSPVTKHQVYRPNSPYLTQQQQPQQPQPSRNHKAVPTASNNTTTTAAVAATHDNRSANVGQLRAPSLTPSAVQRQGHQHQHSTVESLAQTTVDPSQVYDAWPEQQRRIREAEARRKANEEAKRIKAEKEENERKAAEAKRLAEEKKAEEVKREQEARKAEAQRKAEAARIAEAERRAAAERKAAATSEAVQARARAMGASKSQSNAPSSEAALAFAGASGAAPGSDLESEMLAMFKKMREFNEKNPTMLARLWDQERRAHLAKSSSPSSSSSHAQPAQTSQSAQPVQPARPPHTAESAQPAHPQATPIQSSQAPHLTASSIQSSALGPPSARPTFAPSKASIAAGPKSNTSLVNSVSGGNAIWPPGKKAHLAEAAAKWLNAKPENTDKHVTGDRLIGLLDSNPSYSTLCETLEQMGLVVDRGSFARALLSAVPDTNKATASRHAGPNTSGGATTAAPANIAANLTELSSSSGGDPTIQRGSNSQPQPKKNGPHNPPNKSKPRAKGKQDVSQPNNATPASGPTTAVTAPSSTDGPSLANMYRTALASDQPSVVAYESRPSFYPPPDDDHYHAEVTPQLSQAPQSSQAPQATMTAPQSTVSPYFQPSTDHQPLSQQARHTPRPMPAQVPRRAPANKEEAARKRTFAELVDLTAADDASDEELEPPAKQLNIRSLAATFDMAPTVNSYAGNSILTNDQFRGVFQHYNYDGRISNKFTPGTETAPQPAIEPVRQVQTPALPVMTSLEQELSGKTLVQGIQREKVARKSHYDPRTICRDVLLATGRHPEMRALNQHLFDMYEFLKKHSTNIEGDKLDLNTIRWDLIDPGEPIVIQKPSEADMDADDEDEDAGEVTSAREDPAHRRKPFMRRGVGRPRKTMSRGESIGGMSGRADSQPPSQTAGANATPTSTSARSIPAPGVISFTPVNQPTQMNTIPLSAPVGYAEFNQKTIKYDENGKPIKRIGRPVGWRKSIHSKAAVAAAASGQPLPVAMSSSRNDQATSSRGRTQSRRGRPSKQVQATTHREPEAEFNVYKCQWEGCKAELHNVDTLRKHVIKLHGKKTVEDDYECFWKECFFDRSGEQDEPFIFERMEEWMEHMESMHIVPVARKLGDGPRLGLSEPYDSEQSDAYLSDATGRIVTPRIEARETREGSQESDAQMAAKRITNLSGVRLENEKLLQQIEQQKRVIGPGLDRGGCTFATAQRRRGFYDDEDFEEVIEPDEIEG